jgi:hypothetical protein
MRCVTPHEVEAVGELIAARLDMKLTCADRASRVSDYTYTRAEARAGPGGPGRVMQTGMVIAGSGGQCG